jgi:phosphate transport system substrate-binding protein
MVGTQRKRKVGIMKKFLPLLLIVFLFCGCNTDRSVPTPTVDSLAGKITFAGSTTLQPLATDLANEFSSLHPNVNMDIAAGGSAVGIQAVHDGTADIGMVSRSLTEEESSGIKQFQVAIDVLAIVVNPDNPVKSLTLQQLQDIYMGKVTNWKDLGGKDLPIVPVQRETTSGSRGAFKELVLDNQDANAGDLETAVTAGDMAARIAAEKGAVGYVGFGNIDDSIRLIAINNVTPTQETAKDGTYPLIRPLIFMTGPLSQPLAQSFIDYALSDAGQKIVNEKGWIPVK